MLSSICVATITGLPAARQARVSRFWIGGTGWTGSSTPRSPRATMMPSEASRISAKALTAAGFSIFDRIAARPSASSRASKTSLGRCTKESASQSTPSSQANSRSLRSLSDSAASGSTTSGTLTPLRFEISPPTTTSVTRVLRRALGDLQPDLAVVDQQRRARPRARRRSPDAAGRRGSTSPSAGSRSKRNGRALGQHRRAVGEGAAAQLRPLQVGEDADRPADLGLDLANQRVAPGDVVVGAVAHVQPEHVGAGDEQARGSSRRCRRRGRGWRRS